MLSSPTNAPKLTAALRQALREKAEGFKCSDQERIQYFETMTVAEIEADSVDGGDTWLGFFLRRKKDVMVQYLIDKGVSVTQQCLHGEIPMIVAARFGSENEYLRLIQNGADRDLTKEQIQRILSLACMSRCITIVKDALARGADVNYKSRFVFCFDYLPKHTVYMAAIHLACNYNFAQSGEIGSMVNYSYPQSELPNLEIVQLLVSSGADVNAVYKFREWQARDEGVRLDMDLEEWVSEFPLLAISLRGGAFRENGGLFSDNWDRMRELQTANREIIAFLVSVGANIEKTSFLLKKEGWGKLFESDDEFIQKLISKQVADELAKVREDLVARRQISHTAASTSSTAMPSSSSTAAVVDTSAVRLPEQSRAQQGVAIESRD